MASYSLYQPQSTEIMSPFRALMRSPHITERQFPAPPKDANPSWVHPQSINPVTVYDIGLDAKIRETKGWWDDQANTWRKVNGQAITILGWK